MTKLPAFQFYPADWRKDLAVQSLTFFERGVWFELLCLMHESEQRGRLILNGRPMPDETVARLLGLDKQAFSRTVTTLLESGVATRDESGALVSRRMLRDEGIRRVRAEAGKKGGNPNLLKQNPTTLVNQNPTPSSSSSISSSSSEEKEVAATAAVEPDPVEKRIWKDGLDLLTKSGLNEKQARPLLGRWARDYGKLDLASAIAVTQAANVPDPKAYIGGIFKQKNAQLAAAHVGKYEPSPDDIEFPDCSTCDNTRRIGSWDSGIRCPDCVLTTV